MAFKKAEVEMFLDIVNQLLAGNRTVQLRVEGGGPDLSLPNGVTATIPSSATVTASKIDGGVRLTAKRPYITVRKGLAFGIKAKGNIDYVSVKPDHIDVSLRGLPDQSIEVEA